MTRPDLDALQALLDKNPHDGTDAAQALLALPALIARVRELEAERDALRECVRAADAMRAECDQVPPMVQQRNVLHVYDVARAAWKEEA